jgi:methyl-accepting chemotaxis protein
MSIKRRIWALPLISTLIFGVGLIVSVIFSTTAINSINTTENIDYPVLERTKMLQNDIQSLVNNLKQAVGEGDKKGLDEVVSSSVKVREKLKILKDINGQQETGDRLSKEFENYISPALSVARIMMSLEEGDPQTTIAQMQTAQKILEDDLDKAVIDAQKQFKDGVIYSGDNVKRVLYTTILVALIVMLTLGIVSYFVIRTIWHQLGGEPEYARNIASAVASGDLSIHIEVENNDSTSLLAALKEMRDRLQTIVSEIKISADTILLASAEIASGNSDLSSRTESQASSLEETASSMEALTDTVKQNADNARQANTMVKSASTVAIKGGQVVSEVVTTMVDINNSSKKIVDIISVIDGIAFQTNILALNAAVEAARAGEQGRGFAVVASEVRSLAQRSAAAAKEIKTLIGDSVDKVTAGSQLVDQAGKTMDEIVASVKNVSDIMAEITAASQEQSAGIGEIGQAIGQMDEMTQQNSALVEQAAAVAESLEEQANLLMQSLDVFKLMPSVNQHLFSKVNKVERNSASYRSQPSNSSSTKTITNESNEMEDY